MKGLQAGARAAGGAVFVCGGRMGSGWQPSTASPCVHKSTGHPGSPDSPSEEEDWEKTVRMMRPPEGLSLSLPSENMHCLCVSLALNTNTETVAA